jgi:hypothetical protein
MHFFTNTINLTSPGDLNFYSRAKRRAPKIDSSEIIIMAVVVFWNGTTTTAAADAAAETGAKGFVVVVVGLEKSNPSTSFLQSPVHNNQWFGIVL